MKDEIKISAGDLGLGGAPDSIGTGQVEQVLGVVYVAAGMVAVLMIIFGGIRYVGANGDSSQIQAAKNTIMYAVAGLVVVIMAAAITSFVIQGVTGAGSGGGSSTGASSEEPQGATILTPDEGE